MNITRLNTLNDDKVIVRVNVPSEGVLSTIEYLDVRGFDNSYKERLLLECCLSLCNDASKYPSYSIFSSYTDASPVDLCAINFSELAYGYSEPMTVKDLLISEGWSDEELASIPRVTKEYYDSYVTIM